MLENSIIEKTGQKWKLLLSSGVVLVGMTCLALGIVWIRYSQAAQSGSKVALSGMLVCWIGIAFGFVAIRCPNCHSRWLWRAARELHATSWIVACIRATECPACHITGRR